uniref:Protein kinase domain-containing protein n=1 Tax=Arcella intermedia TaxID=1963864 RepID=A0A6B2LAV5_9EUKA
MLVAKIIDLEKYPHQYLAELCSLTVCKHEFIISLAGCQILSNGTQGCLFIQHYPYPTLEDVVCESEKGLTERKAMVILSNLVSGLDYIHRHRIAHHDLTPGNILLEKKSGRVKIIDFGLSIAFESDHPSVLHSSGTPLFMSPEVLQNSKHNPILCDIWSLGVILYFMLTNSFPWSNFQKSKDELLQCIFKEKPDLSGFSESIKTLIQGMLSSDPEERWILSEIQLIVTEFLEKEMEERREYQSKIRDTKKKKRKSLDWSKKVKKEKKPPTSQKRRKARSTNRPSLEKRAET